MSDHNLRSRRGTSDRRWYVVAAANEEGRRLAVKVQLIQQSIQAALVGLLQRPPF